jgi:hypothetical protein
VWGSAGYCGGRAPQRANTLTVTVSRGLFFVLLAQTSPDSAMWPLVAVRATSLSLGLAVLLVGRRRGGCSAYVFRASLSSTCPRNCRPVVVRERSHGHNWSAVVRIMMTRTGRRNLRA